MWTLVLLCLAAVAETPEPAVASEVADGGDLAPITFSELALRDRHWILGELDASGRHYVSERLRMGGLAVVGAEGAVLDVGHGSRARFVLGGTLTRVSARSKALFTEFEIEVAWELLDPSTEQVVYTAGTTGYAASGVAAPNEGLAWTALEDAVLRLAAREPLRALLRSEGARPPALEDPEWNTLRIARCETDVGPLPQGLEQATDAAATIVASGGRSGSAVVVSADGYVLTAAHVLEGDEEVEVVLRSGPRLASRIVRIRSDRDVALVKLPGTGFPCVPVRVERPPLGAEVFAIGSPLGESFELSVSRGIVSGFRELEGRRFVQTDAAVDPGSSGGPLLDAEGRVVALTAGQVAGAAEGHGFGIPSQAALEALSIALDERSDAPPHLAARVGGAIAALQVVTDAHDPSRFGTLTPGVDAAIRKKGVALAAGGAATTALGVGVAGASYARYLDDRGKSLQDLQVLHGINAIGWTTAVVGSGLAGWGIAILVKG